MEGAKIPPRPGNIAKVSLFSVVLEGWVMDDVRLGRGFVRHSNHWITRGSMWGGVGGFITGAIFGVGIGLVNEATAVGEDYEEYSAYWMGMFLSFAGAWIGLFIGPVVAAILRYCGPWKKRGQDP
jgi:hypothetical protein